MKNDSSRRDFIRKSVSAVTGTILIPSIIPASALGKNGFVAASDRIVMATIGTGAQGMSDMKDFMKLPQAQFVAVCDLDKKRLEKGAETVNLKNGNKDCRQYKDYRELLEKEKLDAVLIAVPDHWHSLA